MLLPPRLYLHLYLYSYAQTGNKNIPTYVSVQMCQNSKLFESKQNVDLVTSEQFGFNRKIQQKRVRQGTPFIIRTGKASFQCRVYTYIQGVCTQGLGKGSAGLSVQGCVRMLVGMYLGVLKCRCTEVCVKSHIKVCVGTYTGICVE